jgi:UDP-glucose 4-epimerase
MRAFITGGAGFIGSHLVDLLVERGVRVTIYDNLSIGQRGFVQKHLDSGDARLVVADLLDFDILVEHLRDCDVVFHLAANPEARWGIENTRLDLEQETLVTYNVLEVMRRNGVRQIVFASSGTVYGEVDGPVDEDHGPLFPISLYGAGKLACEALISAFVGTFELQGWIFRFGNVLGPRGTHGAVMDFIAKLKQNPRELEILGDGEQRKPYLHVHDCVDGILYGYENASAPLNYFNLGPPDTTQVSKLAELLIAEIGLKKVQLRFAGGKRGWPGDVPRSFFEIDKMSRLGWKTRYSSDEAAHLAIREMVDELDLEAHFSELEAAGCRQ